MSNTLRRIPALLALFGELEFASDIRPGKKRQSPLEREL